ncbi:MAG: hypothetical protein KBC30_11400 [Planctomycetes bacterium]|jgi:hypothetical protein|nr:hypothetical protein [Planctomycetota bacterium]HPY76024.1 hypothetical protein [Planctomycetota bacterium]HQB01561.1 hypothetical protein [Planctomycetota bacterium]
MKLRFFTILLLIFSFCIMAQEAIDEDMEFELTEEATLEETFTEDIPVDSIPTQDPIVEEAEAPSETTAPAKCFLCIPEPKEENRDFWLSLSLCELIIFFLLVAQVLERILELFFGLFKFEAKCKLFLGFFLGIILAGVLCFFLEAYVILDRVPAIVKWNAWGKLLATSFIIYALTQPLHKLANPKLAKCRIQEEVKKEEVKKEEVKKEDNKK